VITVTEEGASLAFCICLEALYTWISLSSSRVALLKSFVPCCATAVAVNTKSVNKKLVSKRSTPGNSVRRLPGAGWDGTARTSVDSRGRIQLLQSPKGVTGASAHGALHELLRPAVLFSLLLGGYFPAQGVRFTRTPPWRQEPCHRAEDE
jgi:hypothetical protein